MLHSKKPEALQWKQKQKLKQGHQLEFSYLSFLSQDTLCLLHFLVLFFMGSHLPWFLQDPFSLTHFAMSTRVLQFDTQSVYVCLCRMHPILSMSMLSHWCMNSSSYYYNMFKGSSICEQSHSIQAISQNKADAVTAPLNNLSSLFYLLLVLIFTTETLYSCLLVEWIRFVCAWLSDPLIQLCWE